MSTGTVDLSTLVAHVPVDRFAIVDGPGAVKCMAVQERLYANPRVYVELVFTLKTGHLPSYAQDGNDLRRPGQYVQLHRDL
jgi:hypothetical protein